jgi:hypothetical protein
MTGFDSKRQAALDKLVELTEELRLYDKPAQEQALTMVPVCHVCAEIHAVLDADESQIIRNAQDGYSEGRTPHELTLLERVTALCTYAADWKRWCVAAETLAQPAQEPVAWGVFEGNLHDMFFTQEEAQEMAQLKGTHAEVRPLYTTPQPAQERAAPCARQCEAQAFKIEIRALKAQLAQPPQRPWVDEAAIRADEREACALIVEDMNSLMSPEIAAAIRARGKT